MYFKLILSVYWTLSISKENGEDPDPTIKGSYSLSLRVWYLSRVTFSTSSILIITTSLNFDILLRMINTLIIRTDAALSLTHALFQIFHFFLVYHMGSTFLYLYSCIQILEFNLKLTAGSINNLRKFFSQIIREQIHEPTMIRFNRMFKLSGNKCEWITT